MQINQIVVISALLVTGGYPNPLYNSIKLNITIFCISSALLVTGSYEDSVGQSVELLQETDSAWTSCSLPDLPDSRYVHTQSGAVVCGGYGGGGSETRSSCLTFSSGSGWTQSHTLLEERVWHSTWKSPRGLLLMGGQYSLKTTELLNEDGTSSKHYDLEYKTR